MRRIRLGWLLVVPPLLVGGVVSGAAQTGPFTIRIALVSQWVMNQHGLAKTVPAPAVWMEFRAALDQGVVNRPVFWWQRGRIERRWGLVEKPLRVLTGAEAAALGGHGQFDLVGIRKPADTAAWTEIQVADRTGQPDDVLVVEVGGGWQTMTQVLGTLLVAAPDGTFRELPLRRLALIPGTGVPVVPAPFGLPLGADRAPLFRGADGVEFLVATTLTPVIPDGSATSNGPADVAPASVGDWREGDRVLIRLPVATVQAGTPAIVLGWRDRVERPGGGEGEVPTP